MSSTLYILSLRLVGARTITGPRIAQTPSPAPRPERYFQGRKCLESFSPCRR